MKHPMYIKLYGLFTICIIEFILVSVLFWHVFGGNQSRNQLFQSLATLLLPAADTPQQKQQKALDKIAAELGVNISLFAPDNKLIAASGDANYSRAMVSGRITGDKWDKDIFLMTVLPDGRQVGIHRDSMHPMGDGFRLIIFLGSMSLLMALTIYPFIRQITRRLEHLQRSVESIGEGILSERVNIEAKDEIGLLAKSFNTAAEKIEKLVNAQRLLLANTSHELRTPLSRIRLGVEMLGQKDDLLLRETLKSDIIELDILINELMLMTRLDSGVTEEKEMVDLLGLAAEEGSHYQECQVEGRPISIYGNVRTLQHLVRNLIDNAVKHGKEPVKVIVQKIDNTAQLIVMDGGAGIPEKEWENVFEPFYRIKGIQNVKGYGLGLPIISKIAKAHGATVKIENSPASAITVTFPATEE